jgi:ribonuclease-3
MRNILKKQISVPDGERKKKLLSFQKKLSLTFNDISLLNLALTHSSVSNESSHPENNERLEFLGDSVLGLVTASLLYERFDGREGELARIKSAVVSEEALAGLARELQIDTALLLGRGEESTGGRNKNAILADALEALIGALFLDGGYGAAESFVSRVIGKEISDVVEKGRYLDYKSLLQVFCQHAFKTYPEYRVVKRDGPRHLSYFWIEVSAGGNVFGPCMGKNKKAAEQEAAKMAYEAMQGRTKE